MPKFTCTASLWLCSMIAVATGATNAQSKADQLQPMDVFNIRYASDPQISPDGSRIVYCRKFSDVMTDKNYSNIWIINFDGSDNRPITSGNHNDTFPRWSPDGTRILYISDQDAKSQVFIRFMDSGAT